MSESAFVDDAGNPVMADAVVLFLDLLGTAGRSGSDGRNQLRRTKAAVDRSRELSVAGQDGDLQRMSWFSDNLGMHYLTGDNDTGALGQLLDDISYVQLGFVQEGLVARGAVARGLYYSDTEFIHGPALERAVALEKTRAVYPRVVLDEASIALAAHCLVNEEGGNDDSDWRRQLWVDRDGTVFVNYLEKLQDELFEEEFAYDLLLQHGRFIAENLHATDGVPRVEEKYRWLAGYHNHFVGQLDEPLRARLAVHCSRPLGEFKPFGQGVDERVPPYVPVQIGEADSLDE